MRFLFLFLAFHIALFSATTLEKKIISQKKILKSKSKTERTINRKLSSIVKDIQKEERSLKKLSKQIVDAQREIAKNESVIKDKQSNLQDLATQNISLIGKKKDLEDKIIKVIAEDFSFYLIADQDYLDSSQSILIDATVSKIGVIIQKEFSKLSHDYEKINKKISVQNNQIQDLKKFIQNLKMKKTQLLDFRKSKKSGINKLARQKKEYRRRLQRISNERDALRNTLRKLNIIKDKEVEKEKRKKLAASKQTLKDQNINGKLTVRQIGSSYQNGKVKRYRGKKTIAPLDSFSVKRKFGTYVDPIYKIKIFNESVILESKIKNAKVKNVLNGKVIYAKDTAVLDKVVIIENSYGIHTIYAHLSKIAPTIKVGKKLKKGYVIGRVENDLSFEVTQKSYHINPLQLIRY